MLVNTEGLDDADRMVVYANFLASNRLFREALRKLAEGAAMRETLLTQSLIRSKKVFKQDFDDYSAAFVKNCCWRLAKDTYLIKKTIFNRRFVTLELTQQGRRVVALADQLIKKA
jgi:hypothetical protein